MRLRVAFQVKKNAPLHHKSKFPVFNDKNTQFLTDLIQPSRRIIFLTRRTLISEFANLWCLYIQLNLHSYKCRPQKAHAWNKKMLLRTGHQLRSDDLWYMYPAYFYRLSISSFFLPFLLLSPWQKNTIIERTRTQYKDQNLKHYGNERWKEKKKNERACLLLWIAIHTTNHRLQSPRSLRRKIPKTDHKQWTL